MRRCQSCSRSSFSSTSAVLFCKKRVLASYLVLKYTEFSLDGFLKKNLGIVLKEGFLSSSVYFSSSNSLKNEVSASLSFSAGDL